MSTQAFVDEVRKFVGVLYEPGDIVELRLLPSGRSFWYTAQELIDDPNIVEGLAFRNCGRERQNIYIGANPRITYGQRKKEGIALARCLFAEFNDASLEEVRERIAAMPEPTMITYSGNGYQVWWRLEEPVVDLTEWQTLQQRLILTFRSDDRVEDASRIMRLPGFSNHKEGKPVTRVHIVEASGELVSLWCLEQNIVSQTDAMLNALQKARRHYGS